MIQLLLAEIIMLGYIGSRGCCLPLVFGLPISWLAMNSLIGFLSVVRSVTMVTPEFQFVLIFGEINFIG